MRSLAAPVVTAALVLSGCSGAGPDLAPRSAPEVAAATVPPGPPSPDASPETEEESLSTDGAPRRAVLSIPAIGVEGLVVEPYRGRTDDAPGTELQNRGLAASPYGPRGGTGPGGIGNYQVTAHRNSSTAAFADLPQLRRGQRVVVDIDGTRLTYEITTTRSTSFRSRVSLAQQRAAVPGRPGAVPTRAMITLSTCATQEDHAAGNYWADELDNPEHRIDKIGVLVSAAPMDAAGPAATRDGP